MKSNTDQIPPARSRRIRVCPESVYELWLRVTTLEGAGTQVQAYSFYRARGFNPPSTLPRLESFI